jgi:hypothetical protein
MKDLIDYVAKAVVDNPDQVKVTQIDGESTVVFELRVNQQDVGKIIGKQGRTINAIRTLLNATAAKAGLRAMLEIVEEGKPKKECPAAVGPLNARPAASD